MNFYLDSSKTDDEVGRELPIAMTDAARFNANDTRRILLQVEANAHKQALDTHPQFTAKEVTSQLVDSRIKRYCYRPFDLRWIYWEMHTKLLDEKREDYFHARVEGGPAMLSAQANRRAFDPPCITRSLASLHVDERTALVTSLQALLPTLFHSNVLHQNVSAAVQERYPEEEQQTNLFFHVLAIMHTPRYRVENSGALLGDWPRIPLPENAKSLTHSALIGRRLADLLDPESDINLDGRQKPVECDSHSILIGWLRSKTYYIPLAHFWRSLALL
jgi:predicted helicase